MKDQRIEELTQQIQDQADEFTKLVDGNEGRKKLGKRLNSHEIVNYFNDTALNAFIHLQI